MGGDGGVIAVKRAWMRGTHESSHKSSKQSGGQNFGAGMTGGDAENRVDPRKMRSMRVRTCHLSSEILRAPIVADELGNLYNKLAILETLSERILPERLSYIRGLKDLRDCHLTPVHEESGESNPVTICPVTNYPLDGSRPFVLFWSTGWILSQAALDSMGLASLQCEYGPCEEHDIIQLFPEDDVLTIDLQQRMTRRREATSLKRKEKRKKRQDKSPNHAAHEAPRSKKPTIALSDAARIASAAKEAVRQKREEDNSLNTIFHDEESAVKKSSQFTDPSKLFIATAPHRYTLG
mmetsp:Transcript_23800/g.30969  ORF Transcript_23800/g.30969 Transcript_23800/m.30969 type:complete len:294 (+) Transcript_23800:63-944(+)|eukprot:CAMPEP_0197288128 /NCGR_PEP_ID=MMETSP0890-20130614/5080_1 /TAXON_ID=44058 ORGANISM="Aureoumbra lagunensis, Strain CCMP1510" /NCGR_SAMPLE_ID=MMETSP0890 /ASSEMBLY_ACC=CAM_ASM_000533 /LENGTH=293 /DNA_ID=CAMNT_0042758595 /DNA_START=9 /DNA_END=890 /DNA_ORIENTATION=-